MVERAQVRCSTCRSPVPRIVLWAIGDSCPRCGTSPRIARSQANPNDGSADLYNGPVAAGVVLAVGPAQREP